MLLQGNKMNSKYILSIALLSLSFTYLAQAMQAEDPSSQTEGKASFTQKEYVIFCACRKLADLVFQVA